MSASQWSGHRDIISNRLWRHQQNENVGSEARGRCVKIVVFIVIYGFVMSYKKKIMYVLSCQTGSVLTRVLFWYLFPSLLRQNNPLMSAETVRHESTYIVLYWYTALTSIVCYNHGLIWNKKPEKDLRREVYSYDLCVAQRQKLNCSINTIPSMVSDCTWP